MKSLLIITLMLSLTATSKPISFRECNKMTAPTRCQFIKGNCKQCTNKAFKQGTLCITHLKKFN